MNTITTVVKAVLCVLFDYQVYNGLSDDFQGLVGAGLGRAQPRFESAEGEFNGVKIGGLGRQVQQMGVAGFR